MSKKSDPRQWCEVEDTILLEMSAAGATYEAVAEAVNRTALSVLARARRLKVSFVHKQPHSEAKSHASNKAIAYHELVRANIMHLVDLKRAGHSPRSTEFKISPDDSSSIRTQPTPVFSSSSCALVW